MMHSRLGLVPPFVEPDDDQDRLPVSTCALVILLANAACYGLGYAVFTGVRYLLSI